MSQFGAPIHLNTTTKQCSELQRVDIMQSKAAGGYDEEFLQNLLFDHPDALPLQEIDTQFTRSVSICTELNTQAGPLDVLLCNDQGALTLVECKLWRNPQARREVVGQIIDYAKELSLWQYEDLQREVSRRTGKSGNAPYDIVKEKHPGIDEATFVDQVSLNMRQGRILLLVVGDGIREGVQSIGEYLQQHMSLQFTFGLIEMPIFSLPDGNQLVAPRTLAKTTVINRSIVELSDERLTVSTASQIEREEEQELTAYQKENQVFWGEVLDGLKLDDPSQPFPGGKRTGANISFIMPIPNSVSWVTAYKSKAGEVGVFCTGEKGSIGHEVLSLLYLQKDQIEEELGGDVNWRNSDIKNSISKTHGVVDLHSPSCRSETIAWLRTTINTYVNVFRPRIEKAFHEISS